MVRRSQPPRSQTAFLARSGWSFSKSRVDTTEPTRRSPNHLPIVTNLVALYTSLGGDVDLGTHRA